MLTPFLCSLSSPTPENSREFLFCVISPLSFHHISLRPWHTIYSWSFLSPLFNLPYALSILTFQNSILVVHFMPEGLPLESVRSLLISVSLIIIFKVCRLLAYSTRSQWWGCHLSLWASWFSVGVSSSSLWSSPFTTRQWCWFWSILGILFSQCPSYLVSLPLSTTWGGAWWKTNNSSLVVNV